MAKKQKNIINKFKEIEAWAIILFVLSIVISLSILGYDFKSSIHPDSISHNEDANHLLGFFGAYTAYYLVEYGLGVFSIVFPIIIFMISYSMFFKKEILNYLKKSIYLFFLFLSISILFDKILVLYSSNEFREQFSGALSIMVSNSIYGVFGTIGFWLLTPVIIIIIIGLLVEVSLHDLFLIALNRFKSAMCKTFNLGKFSLDKMGSIVGLLKGLRGVNKKTEIEISKPNEVEVINNESENELIDNLENQNSIVNNIDESAEKQIEDEYANLGSEGSMEDEIEHEVEDEIEIEDEVEIEQGNLDEDESRKSKYKNYQLPLTEHLTNPIEIDKDDDAILTNKARELQHALETFGVKSEVRKITQGPIITMFEIEPHEGVRVNKFTNLSDDLARVMAAQRIRVIAPIPGTKSIGVELPNENPSIVYLKTIINSEQYINSESKLTIGLGKTTTGDAYIFDLAKMPHLLVAGATGAGKSVCINTIIVSILYKAKPDEVKFIMVDPKKLELATYKSLVGYHLITAPNLDEYVMTTAENAVGILSSAITEMERRFQVFSDARVRNIAEYHDRCKENEELESIPYIVVLIDELADLMMTSGRAVEEPITRLAQKARAVGVHLVVATQRPSVDVITGLIKSNFPARISFQVSSKVDSRTILDQMGAEKLLGRGDMLFLLPGSASPVRLHNAFVELNEIENIMNHIGSQPKPSEIHLPEIAKVAVDGNFSVNDETNDDLLYEAAKIVIDNEQASVSLLQRKLRVGYSRAGRLIDELESLGIISEHNGSKPRDVLVDSQYVDNIFNK